jgi:DNA polymerase-3 subunit gamma/tau
MVVQTLGEVPRELSLTPEDDAALAAQAERVQPALVLRLLDLLGAAREGVRAGADARTRLELALVKAAKPALDSSTIALLARIERLEGRPAAVHTEPHAAQPESRVDQPPAVAAQPESQAAQPEAPLAQPDAAQPAAGGVERGITQPAHVLPVTIEPAAFAPARAKPDEPANAKANANVTPASVEPLAGTTPGSTAGAPPEQAGEPMDVEAVVGLWPAVVELVIAEHALCGAVIADARPVELEGEDLTVGFSMSAAFLKRQAEDPDNRAIVTEAIRRLTGRRVRLSYELREELGEGGDEMAGADGRPISEEELLSRLKAEFDAEEIPIASDSAPVAAGEKGE